MRGVSFFIREKDQQSLCFAFLLKRTVLLIQKTICYAVAMACKELPESSSQDSLGPFRFLILYFPSRFTRFQRH